MFAPHTMKLTSTLHALVFSCAVCAFAAPEAITLKLWPGGRQHYCPSSPAYRDAARRLVEAMAERYGGHPALAMWHVNNEYGCHVSRCYCDVSGGAFRDWLCRRYGDSLDALNFVAQLKALLEVK